MSTNQVNVSIDPIELSTTVKVVITPEDAATNGPPDMAALETAVGDKALALADAVVCEMVGVGASVDVVVTTPTGLVVRYALTRTADPAPDPAA